MASNQEDVNKVYKKLFTKLWQKSCGEYLNFGMFHDQCKTLTEANDYMVDWIIKEMHIDQNSKLLDIGCGRGKYTAEIAKKSGCNFTGIDIVEEFIESANELKATYGLVEKGQFCVGDMLDLSDTIGEKKYTHVLALGCLFYVHDKMPQFLQNLKPHCSSGTRFLIHDFSRNCELEKVSEVMKHWRTTAATLHTDEYLHHIKTAGFNVDIYSDDTHMGLRSCQWVVDVAKTISDDENTFTFWVLRDALKDRRIQHNTILTTLMS